ncbi:MAG: hypothetical protein KF901_32675 [Myxococcales bacterium]|nr:hypothetical protein [Myxococcales bacterium]
MTDPKLDHVHRALDEGRDVESLGLSPEVLGEARALARVDAWLADLAGSTGDALSEDAAQALATRIEQRLDEPLAPTSFDPLAPPSFEGFGDEGDGEARVVAAPDAHSGEYALEALAAGVQRAHLESGASAGASSAVTSAAAPAPARPASSGPQVSGGGARTGGAQVSGGSATGARVSEAQVAARTRRAPGAWLAAAAMLGLAGVIGVGALTWRAAAPESMAARVDTAASPVAWDESVAPAEAAPSEARTRLAEPTVAAPPEAAAEEAELAWERDGRTESLRLQGGLERPTRGGERRASAEPYGRASDNPYGRGSDDEAFAIPAAPERTASAAPPPGMNSPATGGAVAAALPRASARPAMATMTTADPSATADVSGGGGQGANLAAQGASAPPLFIRRTRNAVVACLVGDARAVTLRLAIDDGRVARVVSSSPPSVLGRPGAQTCLDAALRGRELSGGGVVEARYTR